jgi:hypothetical protein
MKKIILLSLTLHFSLFTFHSFAQMGEWTWMNGTDSVNSHGHYGTQGVFDSLNYPPAAYEACEWTDLNGNFWLFGGSNAYCDLWEFKPSINQWAWIKGPGIHDQYGIYGIQGVPSDTNNPGTRCYGITTWVDLSGNLWLFGGGGYALNSEGALNDLWKYNIATNEWTWMAGPDTADGYGSYGTILVSSPSNNPPPRSENNASWVDSIGNLWFFGGDGNRGAGNSYNSDLWKYDVSINQWTWMKGPNTGNQPGVYGIKGIPDSANNPGGRWCYAKWKDSNGDFWLFGGSDTSGGRNDLWRYNLITNEWTWMSGQNFPNDTGTSGTQCIANSMNTPSARIENRSCWTKACDNFINFGGVGPTLGDENMNDLWNYNVSSNQWTWMSGSVTSSTGHYGSKTISSPNNLPPGRRGSVGWSDNSGNLWLWGGSGDLGAFYNDMWRFVPDSTCPYLCNQTEGAKEIATQRKNIVEVYPNPVNNIVTIRNYELGIRNELDISDVLGKTVYHQALNKPNIQIDVSQWSNGVYFYKVTNSKETYRGKFVKE